MHLCLLANLALLAPAAWARAAVGMIEEPAAPGAKAEAEENAAAGKGAANIPAGEGYKVFLSLQNLNPALNPGKSPDCGLFVEENHPRPGGGTLIHVRAPSAGAPLAIEVTREHNPVGMMRHEVGRVLPAKVTPLVAAARGVPAPAAGRSHIPGHATIQCVGWAKGLVPLLQAKGLLSRTGTQKAGQFYQKYSGTALNTVFLGQMLAPTAAHVYQQVRGNKGLPTAGQIKSDASVMQQDWKKAQAQQLLAQHHNPAPAGHMLQPPPPGGPGGAAPPVAMAHPMALQAGHPPGATPGYPVNPQMGLV